MILRFTKENWEKFKQGKKTTTRFKRLKDGVYDVVTGSRYKPEVVGKVKIEYWFSCSAEALLVPKEDEIIPGMTLRMLVQGECFDCPYCLFAELMRLNPKKSPHDTIYIHEAEVI
jgi:hypothetical protein